MKYTTILFDLDGTLIDFQKAEEHSFFYTMQENEIPATEAFFKRYHEINSGCWAAFEKQEISKEELVVRRFQELFKEFHIDQDAASINHQYLHNLALEVYLVEGAIPLLEKLYGKFALSVVTNGVSHAQHRRLNAGKLSGYFNHIIVSEDAGASKPHKQFFDYTFEKLGNPDPSTVLVVGDSLTADIRGALDYGLDCCYFNPNGLPLPEGIAPTYTIGQLAELLPILLPHDQAENSHLRSYYLEQDYNCAETLLLSLADDTGLSLSPETLKAIGSFGGGMACGETCGALAGMLAMVGMTSIDTKAHQSTILKERCQNLVKAWEEKFGTLRCCEIKPRYFQKNLRCVATCEQALAIYRQVMGEQAQTMED